MRQITRKGLMTVAAATGVIAASGGYASADTGAQGSASHPSGVLSGNSVQVPVDIPVNVCGNTVNVLGALNPSVGTKCANESDGSGSHHDSPGNGGYGDDGSGNVASGNNVQVPVDIPVNVCGNSVDISGIGNPATGNDCGNDSDGDHENPSAEQPGNPGTSKQPGPSGDRGKPGGDSRRNTPGTQTVTQPKGSEQLAATGSEMPLGLALPVGAGAILGGALLYRKARATS